MAVRLDPLQRIVNVNWGAPNIVTHVAFDLYVQTLEFRTENPATVVPAPSLNPGFNSEIHTDGYTTDLIYRLSLGTSGLRWNGTAWDTTGLIGVVAGSQRLLKVLGWSTERRTVNPPAWRYLSPRGLPGFTLTQFLEMIGIQFRFNICPTGPSGEGAVPVYFHPGKYYAPGITSVVAECFGISGSGALLYNPVPPLSEPEPPEGRGGDPYTALGPNSTEYSETSNLLSGLNITYDGRPCTVVSVFTPDSINLLGIPPGSGGSVNLPRNAKILCSVAPP